MPKTKYTFEPDYSVAPGETSDVSCIDSLIAQSGLGWSLSGIRHGREPPLKFDQRPLVPLVGRTDRRQVLVPDHAPRADRFLGPRSDWVLMPLQPDVRQHPGPTTVAVEERVDSDRAVVKPRGLLREAIPLPFPEGEVVEECLEL